MDIVADTLSANILSARNVTVRGQDIFDWFQSKLSSSVSFVGVFQSLDDAPRKNGAVAIVGSKDYIYSEQAGDWQEFGDEGQIGALSQAVNDIAERTDQISVAFGTNGDYTVAIGVQADPGQAEQTSSAHSGEKRGIAIGYGASAGPAGIAVGSFAGAGD